MIKNFILAFFLLLATFLRAQVSGEDANSPTTNLTVTQLTTLTVTGCGATTYNLGTLPASGFMANDVWFKFIAPSTVVKIKVCNPTTFDSAIEVYNSNGTTATTLVSGGTINIAGSGGKEYGCITGLTYNAEYRVRVGRASGTGAGTFSISIEHNAVQISSVSTPFPQGASCYTPASQVKRTNTAVAVTAPTTTWLFVDSQGTTVGPCAGVGNYNLSNCPGFCLGTGTWTGYCQVQSNDAECGNIDWGYSLGLPMVFCEVGCPSIISPACNSTVSSISSANFSCTSLGAGFTYQWRFVTDNGNTEFCSNWGSGTFNPSGSSIAGCFRFNKLYSVYVRARYCATEVISGWCEPACVILSAPLPYLSFASGTCCRWRNANGGLIQTSGILGISQYRYRFVPIDPCDPLYPLTPTGPAITTGWGTSSVNPNGLVTPGKIYMVQVQGRVNANNCPTCGGSTVSLPIQQIDWGYLCIIGFRSASSPAVGTPIGCYCSPNFVTAPIEPDEEIEVDFSGDKTVGVMTIASTGRKMIAVNISESGLTGDGILKVYNTSGQLIYEQNIIDAEYSPFIQVDIEQQLQTGVYIVTAQTGSGSMSQKVFLQGDN